MQEKLKIAIQIVQLYMSNANRHSAYCQCATEMKLKSKAEENKKKINSLALSCRNALMLCSTVLSQIPTRVHRAEQKDSRMVFNKSISIVNKETGK